MAFASDQKPGPENPSPISKKMIELTEIVFAEWERRVRKEVREAGSVPHPVLIDTLPALYLNLSEALTPGYPRTGAAVSTPSVAAEHGGERARLTSFTAESVIAEYQILRTTIIDVLRQHQVRISDTEMQIITSAFDASIREAATAFTLAHSAFREQFMATLVHDVRNPLSAAQNAAQLILYLSDPQAMRDYAKKIVENLHRVDHMVREMLDNVIFEHGARLSLELTHFDMGELVQEVIHDTATVTGNRVLAKGEPVQGWWDRDYMKRALENMISNALKYGRRNTPITIGHTAYMGRIELSVHNEGEPVPADQVESIFQIFRRAQAAKIGDGNSWGIGLPFVRSVAECHGGSIDLDSSLERGTTFTIDVPLDCRPFQTAPTLTSGRNPND